MSGIAPFGEYLVALAYLEENDSSNTSSNSTPGLQRSNGKLVNFYSHLLFYFI